MTTSRSRGLAAAALALLGPAAAAQEVTLPSGLAAQLYDVVLEEGAVGGVARFRLVVPGLGGAGADAARVGGDFRWACEALALPALGANGWEAAEVVISLGDREVPFGAADPEAVQFFEGFRVEEGACVPQPF